MIRDLIESQTQTCYMYICPWVVYPPQRPLPFPDELQTWDERLGVNPSIPDRVEEYYDLRLPDEHRHVQSDL